MPRISLKYWIAILALISSTSCLDPIEFNVEENPNILVVDAVLNLTESTQQVILSRTLPFEQKFFNPESGAQINLVVGDQSLPYIEIEEGIYSLDLVNLQLEEGETYILRITTAGGQRYASTPEVMPVLQRADTADSRFEREKVTLNTGVEITTDVLNTYLSTDITARIDEEVFLKWYYDELYLFTEILCGPLDPVLTCYVPIDGNNQAFSLVRSSNVGGSRIEDVRVARKTEFPLTEFGNRHYFIIYQQSITKGAYEYWSKVQEVTRQQGTVFDKPPAAISGNIFNTEDPEDRVLGYFELMAVDTIRPFIFPAAFKEAITTETLCSFTSGTFGPECCNCLRLPMASLDRPSWIN